MNDELQIWTISRIPVTVDDLGHGATEADLAHWEHLLHCEVVAEDRIVSCDYDAVRRRDVYEVNAENESIADEIVVELYDRAWSAFCSPSASKVQS